MKRQAGRIAQGDYTGRVEIHGNDELGQLGETLMSFRRVEEAQETMDSERRRLDSVLTHMTDGVIGTDRRGNVIIINETALSLLETTNEEALGKSILDLLDIRGEYSFRMLLEEQEEILLDFSASEFDQVILRADFAIIRRESGFISGLVCVLHDVTEQTKAEQERRQFVSNVSHDCGRR